MDANFANVKVRNYPHYDQTVLNLVSAFQKSKVANILAHVYALKRIFLNFFIFCFEQFNPFPVLCTPALLKCLDVLENLQRMKTDVNCVNAKV